MRGITFVLLTLTFQLGFGQQLEKNEIEQLAHDSFIDGITLLRDFLTLPNVGSKPNNIDLNVSWCVQTFAKIDFKTEVLVSKEVKHVYAHKIFKKNGPTILFYLQIDGQPVDSSKWLQENPYKPVLKNCQNGSCEEISWDSFDENWLEDWRIFARSASDSKGPAIAFIQALKVIDQQGIIPDFNIKIIMDFQEELGSPTLSDLVNANKEKFNADVMLIMDGTRPPANLPTVTFGARGIATMKLTVFGSNKILHSGQYGNYSPNPVFPLSRLLGSMKDEKGKVLIPGYYEGINFSEAILQKINAAPENQEEILNTLGISEPEAVGNTYQEALQFPSLNVRGLQAAWVGENVRTVIPSEAIAEIDMRLVPETPAERQIELVRKFIKTQGFYVLDDEPSIEERRKHAKLIKIESRIGSAPFRTNLDSSLGLYMTKAMDHVFGKNKYVLMQTTGGSQPVAPFVNLLGIPAVSIRIPNPDNNIHAPNENIRLENFYEGIKMCLGILSYPYNY